LFRFVTDFSADGAFIVVKYARATSKSRPLGEGGYRWCG
jgi:hypothetical protein